MLNVLYFWWLKGKHMVAMIGDETLKILSTKIHTYMEEMPRKVKKFLRKKFQTEKKMKTDFFFPTK